MHRKRVLTGFAAAVVIVATAGCLKGSTDVSTTVTPTDWSKVTFDTSLHIHLDSMVHTALND